MTRDFLPVPVRDAKGHVADIVVGPRISGDVAGAQLPRRDVDVDDALQFGNRKRG